MEMAQSLCASNAISLDDDYAYEASDSQVEGSKESDSDGSDDLPVVDKWRPPLCLVVLLAMSFDMRSIVFCVLQPEGR